MAVFLSEIEFFGSTNMPEADSVTVGGAVDFSKRFTFADLTATGTVDVVSSSASDTATKIIYSGRDSTGTPQSETLTLTGTTIVTGTKSLARLLAAATTGAAANGPLANPGGTAAAGDVALIQHARTIAGHTCQAGSANHSGVKPALMNLQAGDGASVLLGMVIRITGGTGAGQLRRAIAASGLYGTDVIGVNADWTTIPDATSTYDIAPGMLLEHANASGTQTTAVIRHFAGATSQPAGGGTTVYYEKLFAVNNDTATALTTAAILKQIDPAGLYAAGGALDIALCTALNDTATAANRQTLPTGIGGWSTGAAPQSISVPGASLPNGAAPNAAGAQGFWGRLTLPASMAPLNSFADYRASGNST